MEDLVKAESFNRIVAEFFEDDVGNRAKLVLSYIKSVSAMLSLVSSVRESDIEWHLQAENILICESFALDHQNYAHYGAFQHVNWQSLRKENKERFNELKEKEFGASLTGDVFSTIHGDLVTELFNKVTVKR